MTTSFNLWKEKMLDTIHNEPIRDLIQQRLHFNNSINNNIQKLIRIHFNNIVQDFTSDHNKITKYNIQSARGFRKELHIIYRNQGLDDIADGMTIDMSKLKDNIPNFSSDNIERNYPHL